MIDEIAWRVSAPRASRHHKINPSTPSRAWLLHVVPSGLRRHVVTAFALFSVDGVQFKLGSSAPGALNVLVPKGDSIPIPPGSYNRVYVFAAAVGGDATTVSASLRSSCPTFSIVSDRPMAQPHERRVDSD